MSSDPSAVQSKNDYEEWTARRDSSRPSPALPRQRGRVSAAGIRGGVPGLGRPVQLYQRDRTAPGRPAAELAAESGSTAAQQRARITEMNANVATITRRVLVTAQRRAGDELPVAATS